GIEMYNSQMTYSSKNQWMCQFNISNSLQIGSYSVRIYAEDNNGNHTNANFSNVMSVCAKTSSTSTPAMATMPTPEEAIAFPSDLVEEATRNVIGKESGEIYPSDVKAVTELTLASTKCDDISFLAEFKGLTILDLANDPSVKNTNDNQITDLSPLQGLTNLKQLFLTRNEISDLTPLQGLTSLMTLHFGGNQVRDLTAIKALTEIQSLHIWGNEISDLSPLQEMKNLKELYIFDNPIQDITPLLNVKKLEELAWGSNQISTQQIENLKEVFPSINVWHTDFQK
ncbi:MAG TPA: leucine-rich repeat domain-containing protein, partial [Candidatus Limiplasma sp.]|nr:leucine-rich repeat domain-containing protein [Candidatus Limiplasma sp.]